MLLSLVPIRVPMPRRNGLKAPVGVGAGQQIERNQVIGDPSAALRQIVRHLKPRGQLLILHLVGSAQLNTFHHQVGGAVGHDHLPPASHWPELLRPVGLQVTEAVDREDLFLVKAECPLVSDINATRRQHQGHSS